MKKIFESSRYFLPWLSFSFFPFSEALWIAPLLQLVICFKNFIQGCSLDWLGAIVCWATWVGTQCFEYTWMEHHFSKVLASSFFLMAAASLILRRPFTLEYAKMETRPDAWDKPIFIRINYLMTSVFSALFLLNFLLSFFPSLINPWLFWAASFVFKSAFIARFPRWYMARQSKVA